MGPPPAAAPPQGRPAVVQQAQVAQFLFQLLLRRPVERVQDLVQQSVGEPLAGAVQGLPEAGGGQRAAQPGGQPPGHLIRPQAIVLGPEAEHHVERRAVRRLRLLQRPPGAGQEFVPPAAQELLFGVGRARVGDTHGVLAQGQWLPSPAAVVMGHQAEQGGFEVVAEAALPGVGPPEAAAEELEGELLEQLVGRVRVTQRPEQVAAHGPAVALQQPLPGGPHCLFRPLVGLADQ
jgi:hypothetical protein